MSRLVAAWTVRAGIIPGTPMPEHEKRWMLTSEWHELDEEAKVRLFHEKADEAATYARQIMNPAVVNWVGLEFLWL